MIEIDWGHPLAKDLSNYYIRAEKILDYDELGNIAAYTLAIWNHRPLTWWQKVLKWNPCNPWRYGVLTAAELTSIANDPYQFLKPSSPMYYAPPKDET